MKQLEFRKCTFQISSDGVISYPKQQYPHIVLAGRSNVGKSSFINHFFQNRNLAKTSSKPGKTGLLNFFNIDDRIFFVDIPGYGYAKRSKQERNKWKAMVDGYFDGHKEKISFLHFIDGRHSPTESDFEFIEWAKEEGKNILFIITKIDKVKKRDRKQIMANLKEKLEEHGSLIFYNIEEKSVRQTVKEQINKVMIHGQA